MEFIKYSSIENHYREREIDKIRMHGLENVQYELTEKIHGANFSFWYNGTDLRVASRSQFVDGTFYGCQEVIDKYSDCVRFMYDCLFGKSAGFPVVIYGELYGPSIQKGIKYGTKKDFVAFDISVNGVRENPGMIKYYLGLTKIKYVPVLGVVNSLSEALAFNNEFQSELGKLHGVDDPENIAEGFVVKPLKLSDMYIGSDRVILKSKNEKWSEKSKAPKVKVQKQDDILVPIIEPYVNINRLDAVTSKLGPLTPKHFGIVIKEFAADVMVDMIKDGDAPEDWRHDDKFKSLGNSINSVVIPFLKRELLPKL